MKKSQEIRFYVVQDSKESKGLVKMYIRFFDETKKTDYFTGIRWPKDRYDSTNEQLLPRFKEDPDVHANNLKIAQYKNIIHQVKMKAFVSGRETNVTRIIESLNHLSPYTDFVSFALKEGRRLNIANIISYQTLNTHRVSIKKLCEFFGKEIIGIEEITSQKIAEMDGYFRKMGKMNNTIAGYHKNIKGYINKAIAQNLVEKNPYDNFKFRYVDGNREALSQDELKRLMQIYEANELLPEQNIVLRRFLFSCLTGIRISDTHRLTSEHVIDGQLVFKPQKGMKIGKILKLPLPNAATKLIANRQKEDAKKVKFECQDGWYLLLPPSLKHSKSSRGLFFHDLFV